jgi:hypothetical protein
VCPGYGFCGCTKQRQKRALHVDDFIPPYGPVTADQFVEWVFLADDMNPNSEPERWKETKQALRAAFVEHMGGEVVDATQLHWSDVVGEADEKSGYEGLIDELRVEWRLCGRLKWGKPLHVDDFIPPDGPVTADQFVEWVLLAENINPNEGHEGRESLKHAIRAAFVKHLGSDVVDAGQLQYSGLARKPPLIGAEVFLNRQAKAGHGNE